MFSSLVIVLIFFFSALLSVFRLFSLWNSVSTPCTWLFYILGAKARLWVFLSCYACSFSWTFMWSLPIFVCYWWQVIFAAIVFSFSFLLKRGRTDFFKFADKIEFLTLSMLNWLLYISSSYLCSYLIIFSSFYKSFRLN